MLLYHPVKHLQEIIPLFPSSKACFGRPSWQVLGYVHQKQSKLQKLSAKSASTRRHEYNIFIGVQVTEM